MHDSLDSLVCDRSWERKRGEIQFPYSNNDLGLVKSDASYTADKIKGCSVSRDTRYSQNQPKILMPYSHNSLVCGHYWKELEKDSFRIQDKIICG